MVSTRRQVLAGHQGCPATPHAHINLKDKLPMARHGQQWQEPYWPAFAVDWQQHGIAIGIILCLVARWRTWEVWWVRREESLFQEDQRSYGTRPTKTTL